MSDDTDSGISARASQYRAWSPPVIANNPAEAAGSHEHSVADLESIRERAYQKGLQLGYEEGIGQAQKQAQYLNAILNSLADPVADLDDLFLEQLLALVKVICARLVRRETNLNPEQIIPIIREAVSALPGSPREVQIHLHPEDALVVREALTMSEENTLWKLVENPGLLRGDCQVMNHYSRVDGTLETRLNSVVAQLLGGVRHGE